MAPPPQQMEMSGHITSFPPDQRRCPYRDPVRGFLWTPAHLGGIVSGGIQALTFLVSVFLLAVLFVHIGGFKLIHSLNETRNSTATLSENNDDDYPTPEIFSADSSEAILSSNITSHTRRDIEPDRNFSQDTSLDHFDEKDLEFLKSDAVNTEKIDEEESSPYTARTETPIPLTEELKVETYEGPFEQIKSVNTKIGNVEIEIVTLLQKLCLLDAGIGIFWFLSIIGLVISIRREIPDLVYINLFMLVIFVVFSIIFSLFVAVLLFYQKKYRWQIIFTIGGFVAGTIICVVLNVIALGYLLAWHRYIDYMSGDDMCLCFSALSKRIKRSLRRRPNQQRRKDGPDGYSIPEATNHPNLPYIDEPSPQHQIQQFSNF